MAYTAILQAREIGRRDMDMVRAAVKLSEERTKEAAAKEQQAPASQVNTPKR